MKIYRYENKAGLGPIFGETSVSLGWLNMPVPDADGISQFEPGEMLCGCTSRKQLAKWFPTWIRRAIKRDGYKLKQYDVPDDLCFVGKHQVAFYFY